MISWWSIQRRIRYIYFGIDSVSTPEGAPSGGLGTDFSTVRLQSVTRRNRGTGPPGVSTVSVNIVTGRTHSPRSP